MDKRTIRASRLLRDEMWGVVCYREDGVLEVQRKEMLVPEDDQERCGTSLCVGEQCTAKYIDNNVYPATLVFESDEKELCLKFKTVQEKKNKEKEHQEKKSKAKANRGKKLKVKTSDDQSENFEMKDKCDHETNKDTQVQKSKFKKNGQKIEGDTNTTNQRKKDIKEQERKQMLAKERTAQQHAAKLFANLHATVSDSSTEPPNPLTSTLNLPEEKSPKPLSNNPVLQNTTPQNLNLSTPEKEPNEAKKANSEGRNSDSSNNESRAHCTVTSVKFPNPACVEPTDPYHFARTFQGPHTNNSDNISQQTHNFNRSPSSTIKAANTSVYPQMSPFSSAFKPPTVPTPNSPYNISGCYPNYPNFHSPSLQRMPSYYPYWYNIPESEMAYQKNGSIPVNSNVTPLSPIIAGNVQSGMSSSVIPPNTPDDSLCSPSSPPHSNSFAQSHFMSSSMTLLNNDSNPNFFSGIATNTESDLDENVTTNNDIQADILSGNMTNTAVNTNTQSISNPTPIESNSQPPCPNCVLKDKEIADLKLKLLEKDSSMSTDVISRKRKHNPKTRPEMKMGDYVIVSEKSAPPAGFQLIAPGAKIAVRPLWLEEILHTVGRDKEKKLKRAAKKGKNIKTSNSGEIIKKLMDGFFDPEELAVNNGTRAFQGNAIYESLKQYAIHCLNTDIPAFNDYWNQKMCSSRQTLKRKSKDIFSQQ